MILSYRIPIEEVACKQMFGLFSATCLLHVSPCLIRHTGQTFPIRNRKNERLHGPTAPNLQQLVEPEATDDSRLATPVKRFREVISSANRLAVMLPVNELPIVLGKFVGLKKSI